MRVLGEQGQSRRRWRLRGCGRYAGACACAGRLGAAQQLEAPWNTYPPQKDVQLGRKALRCSRSGYPLQYPKVDAYLTKLG